MLKLFVLVGTVTWKVPSLLTGTVWLTPLITTITDVPLKSTPLVAVSPASVSTIVVSAAVVPNRLTEKVLLLPSAALSPVILLITIGGVIGAVGACSRFSKLKLCVLDRPMASKPDVSNCVDARVSVPSRSIVKAALNAEPVEPPAAVANSSPNAVVSAPSSNAANNAAKFCSISSVIGWALPSASTSFATGSDSCPGIKLLLLASRITAPSGTASPALMIATFPFLSITSSWFAARFAKDNKS